MKLTQKHLLKGTQEFELLDDSVNVRIKTRLGKTKENSVVLAILNPEPELNGSNLEFRSRVKCGPLLSFFVDNPNKEEYEAFVNAVKEKALKEYNAFAGL